MNPTQITYITLITYLSGVIFCIMELYKMQRNSNKVADGFTILLAILFYRESMKIYLTSWAGFIILKVR